MTNDIGMIKSVQPSVAQTHPTAPIGRAEKDVRAVENSETATRAAEAGKEQKTIDGVISDLNNLVRDLHRELQFSVDEDSGSTVIKVVDRQTDEVVRQIPSEELMNLRKRLEEAAGVFFEDSA